MPSGQEVDQCRLAGPVGPDDAQPLPSAEHQVDPGQHRRPRRVVKAGAVALDDLVTQPWGVEGQLQRGRPGRSLGPVVDQAVGGVDPGLGFAATGPGPPVGARPAPVGPGSGGWTRPTAACSSRSARACRYDRVPSVVHVGPTSVELHHPGGDPVEQVTVVGHEDHTAAARDQAPLEPRHRAQVEMVGRLVEYQELGWVGQRPGQRHPFGLPSGQGGHVGVELGRPSPGGRGPIRPPNPPRRPTEPSRAAAPAPGRASRPGSRGRGGPGPRRGGRRRPSSAAGWICRCR